MLMNVITSSRGSARCRTEWSCRAEIIFALKGINLKIVHSEAVHCYMGYFETYILLIFHVLRDFVTDIFPPLSLLIFFTPWWDFVIVGMCWVTGVCVSYIIVFTRHQRVIAQGTNWGRHYSTHHSELLLLTGRDVESSELSQTGFLSNCSGGCLRLA